MVKGKNLSNKIIITLLKEPFLIHTVTSMIKDLKVSRQGLWKTIKILEKEDILRLESVGKTKTSAFIIRLNWKNPLLEKTISIQLIKESLEKERWKNNFAELESQVKFLILFGSILDNPREAGDIDILAVVKNKNSFRAIEQSISKIQKTQVKKIHLVDLTEKEFANELKRQNKAYIDAIKKGVVLFGIDNYIKFIRLLNEK